MFIRPMLATRLEDPRRLADPRTLPSPSSTGSAPSSTCADIRTVHAFSRPGREMIRLPGLAWLRDVRWPIASAVLDGEAVADDGSEGIQAVFEARNRPGSPMAFTAFDLLELDGQSVMDEAWTVRRKRLEDLLEPPFCVSTSGSPATIRPAPKARPSPCSIGDRATAGGTPANAAP